MLKYVKIKNNRSLRSLASFKLPEGGAKSAQVFSEKVIFVSGKAQKLDIKYFMWKPGSEYNYLTSLFVFSKISTQTN
ncbi:hypothetical protein D3C87_1866090 [compost metagenome]